MSSVKASSLPTAISAELAAYKFPEIGAAVLPKAESFNEAPQDKLKVLPDYFRENPYKHVNSFLLEIVPDDVFIEIKKANTRESRHFVREVLEHMNLSGGALQEQIENSLEFMWDNFSADAMNCRFEIVSSNSCAKFHHDNVDTRLIFTCAGPGTEVIDPESPDEICHIETGQPFIVKGSAHSAFQPVLLHRSPPVEGSGIYRMLFIVDF